MTDENYLQKLADMQTQIKELVPDSLKENGERRMTEYICQEVQTDNGGYLEPVKELIRCKDCFYHFIQKCDKNRYGTWWSDDDYCSKAKRKEK